MFEIRLAKDEDFPLIWDIFHSVVKTGDTYVFAPSTNYEEAKTIWMSKSCITFVALDHGEICGTYILKENQPGLGAHVANASFMVHPNKHGKGIGRKMAEHALKEAKRRKFKAMQFNIVISSNMPAVKLWEKLGFKIIGTAPKAFNHKDLGLVDAHIMHRFL